jgi:hypothetical protein
MFVSLLSVKYAVRCNSALCDTGGEDIECCVPHFRKISTDVDAYKKGLAQNLKSSAHLPPQLSTDVPEV